jgi:hypothetical protein
VETEDGLWTATSSSKIKEISVGTCLTIAIDDGNSKGEIRCPDGTSVIFCTFVISIGGRGRPNTKN